MKILAAQRLRNTIFSSSVEDLDSGDFVNYEGLLAELEVSPRVAGNLCYVKVSGGGGSTMVRTSKLKTTGFKFTPAVRSQLQKEILRKTHKDFLGSDKKSIMVNRGGAATMVPVTNLTDKEIFSLVKIKL